MECLTQKEKTVLACVAGLTNGKMSYRETASFLGISCGMVAQIVARIKQKAVVFRNIIKPTDGEQSS